MLNISCSNISNTKLPLSLPSISYKHNTLDHFRYIRVILDLCIHNEHQVHWWKKKPCTFELAIIFTVHNIIQSCIKKPVSSSLCCATHKMFGWYRKYFIFVHLFHVSNSALFSTWYFSTLILYRRSLDTFYRFTDSGADDVGSHSRCTGAVNFPERPIRCFATPPGGLLPITQAR